MTPSDPTNQQPDPNTEPVAGVVGRSVVSGTGQNENTTDEAAVSGVRERERVVADLVSRQLAEARDGASMQRLAALEFKVAAALRASRADATHTAYRSDWADFTVWCETLGAVALPAEPATVAAYLADMAAPPDDRKPLATATIARRKSAISEAHKAAGQPNPCLDPLVKQVSKGVRRQLGVAAKNRKLGLSTADMKAMLAELDTGRMIDVRDKALLLLGFATALRRSELVALDVGDVQNHAQGLLVIKRRSKTDQEGEGQQIEVAYGEHPETCPVRAYRVWLEISLIGEGPVFRAVDRHGTMADKRLNDRSVARIIKKNVQRIGYDTRDFAGHSLRRGFSTEASRNGATDRVIASTTGHTSAKGLRPYIEDAEVFTDPPSAYLGL